jgi:hypothetical protein
VKKSFTGKDLTRLGETGLIRRFFKRHRLQEKIDEKGKVEGRRECKYSVSSMVMSLLNGVFLGPSAAESSGDSLSG